jgi:hypothetical protein
LRRSLVNGEELLSDLIVEGDVGWGVVQVLFDIIGSVSLIRRGRNKRGGSSIERHSSEEWSGRRKLLWIGWEWKRDDEGKRPIIPLDYIQLTQRDARKGKQ